jgi:hypothetical protein
VNNLLETKDLDDAFELLLVITGIICAIMSQYPEYFWRYFAQYPEGYPMALAATRSLILPLILALVLWISGKLVTNPRYQAIIKVFAWMYALSLTFGNALMYLLGSGWLPLDSSAGALLGNIVFFLIVPSFNYFVVLPKYKTIYPQSRFLQSKIMFIAASFVALLLFLFTAGFFTPASLPT